MKKFLNILTAALAFVALAACTEKLGTEPGTDSAPKTTIYQYSPGDGYNSDEDVKLRFVANDKASKVFYFVELKSDKDAFIKANGENAYVDKILKEGEEVPSDKLKAYDVTLTGLAGTYAVTALSQNGTANVLSETLFYGLSWTTVSTGTYEFAVLGSMGIPPVQTEFQSCDMDPNMYRFKDVYGPGYSLKIVTLPDYTNTDDDGTYTFCRVPNQPTGLTYGDFGAIGVRDIGYWQGDESYVTEYGYESCYYTDGPSQGELYIMVQYYIAAGNLGYNYDSYIPDVPEGE